MNGVLGITLQSMQNDMKRLEKIANNTANVSTPGYKREIVIEHSFGDVMTNQVHDAVQNRAIPNFIESVSDQSAATLKATGTKFYFAISGTGFFEITTKSGIAYTRKGNFHLDPRGRLVTESGDAVMGVEGELIFKDENVKCDGDGRLYAQEMSAGDGHLTDRLIGQLRIVGFEAPEKLVKRDGGLFVASGEMAPSNSKQGTLMQGHLENSNVNSMDEMMHLMQTMRHFESMMRLTQGYDEMIGTAIKKFSDIA